MTSSWFGNSYPNTSNPYAIWTRVWGEFRKSNKYRIALSLTTGMTMRWGGRLWGSIVYCSSFEACSRLRSNKGSNNKQSKQTLHPVICYKCRPRQSGDESLQMSHRQLLQEIRVTTEICGEVPGFPAASHGLERTQLFVIYNDSSPSVNWWKQFITCSLPEWYFHSIPPSSHTIETWLNWAVTDRKPHEWFFAWKIHFYATNLTGDSHCSSHE